LEVLAVALVLTEFQDPVLDQVGNGFKAKACALPNAKGLWQGWIEFDPLNGAPTFRSPAETMQATRSGVVKWAAGLTTDHLSCALDRARVRIGA
jgi:hypothetical protein